MSERPSQALAPTTVSNSEEGSQDITISASGEMVAKTGKGMMWLARAAFESGMYSKAFPNQYAVFIAMAKGKELGLSPMASLDSIAVINGRPSVWGDAALALCQASGELLDMTEDFDGKDCAVCTITRKGRKSPITRRFSVEDAKRAGLWGKGGPWSQYPQRMLQLRARGFALRDAFADVLRGMPTVEEARDYDIIDTTGTARPETPALTATASAMTADGSGNFRTAFTADPPDEPEPEPAPKERKPRKAKPEPEPVVQDEPEIEPEVIEQEDDHGNDYDDEHAEGDDLF